MKLLFRSLLCFIWIFCSPYAPFVMAANLDLSPQSRPQIRNRINQCETMLVTGDQVDDSVGIPFSSNSPADFENELSAGIAQYGIDKFRNGTFYVLGIPMKSAKEAKRVYSEIIRRAGLESVNVKVSVLSVPSHLIQEESVGLARQALERWRYFFPSITRDYQTPQWGEVMSDWKAALAIESVNVYFLYQSMPVRDATLVVATHSIVLGAYLIYSKTMLNYLLRKGSTSERYNTVELFLKQMLTSLPFVLNYNVFGHLSDILNHYAAWGWEKTMESFPYEVAHFTTTQGLTLFLQTVFYSQIITKALAGGSIIRQATRIARDARTLRPLLQVPILATDAVLLMLASSNWQPLLEIGPFEVNGGHVGLAALTAGMALFFKKFPQALQPILLHYQKRLRTRGVKA